MTQSKLAEYWWSWDWGEAALAYKEIIKSVKISNKLPRPVCVQILAIDGVPGQSGEWGHLWCSHHLTPSLCEPRVWGLVTRGVMTSVTTISTSSGLTSWLMGHHDRDFRNFFTFYLLRKWFLRGAHKIYIDIYICTVCTDQTKKPLIFRFLELCYSFPV